MTGNQYIPCLPFILDSHASTLNVVDRQPPSANGSPFPIVTIREPNGAESRHLEIPWPAGYTTVKCWEPAEEGEDPRSIKARRRRFQAYLATVRKPEPEFLPPVMRKPGKRAVVRWGARTREQRERRKP